MRKLALQATAMFAALGCRAWFERVPSDDNPADVLSRDGLDDPYVAEMVRTGKWKLREPV